MGSVHDVIEALRTAPSNSERGTAFERLMMRYFELDPMLSAQYEEVCRWPDWPGRDGRTDLGIDLVARERDTGEYVGIQCKFYEPEHTLPKGQIDSFLNELGREPFTKGIIISTTDKWGSNAEGSLDGRSKPVSRNGLDVIADSPIDWDIAWPTGRLEINLSSAQRHQPRPA